MLFRTCSKFAAFCTKNIFLVSNTLLATSFVVSMLIVSEKNSCVSVFGPFLVPKIVHFTFSQPLLGCMGLFSVHFIATSSL